MTPIDLEPADVLLEGCRPHQRRHPGVIVAGRQRDPELRGPSPPRLCAGFPILAEPTSQLRCGPHDRSHVIADLRSGCATSASGTGRPDLILRFGEMPTSKPLRPWLADSGADQIVVDPHWGWNEPTRRAAAILRADPTELASGWSARLGKERPCPDKWLEARRRQEAHSRPSCAARRSPSPAPLALGHAYRDGELVYTASSMPIRDQEAFLAGERYRRVFLCNRGANGIDGLIASGIGAAHATGRPATIVTGDLGLLHDIGGLAALHDISTPVRIVVIDNDGGGIFHFLPQARPSPTKSSRPCSAHPAVSTSPRRPHSSTSPTAASNRSPTCPTPSPRAPA